MKKMCLICGLMILFFLSGCIEIGKTDKIEKLGVMEKDEIRPEAASVAYGWSTNDNAKEAVVEAVSSIKEKLVAPDYVILFSTVGFDSEEVLREVNRLLPQTKVYGGTSMLAVLTRDGFHEGKVGSLALMAVSSEKMVFGVGGADLDEIEAREAGKQAITAAIQNAEKQGKPKLVLMTAAPGEEEEIIRGIEDVIGQNIPIIGGSSGDNDLSGQWKQFANQKVYSNGVSLTAIFTDLKIGWAYEAGYLVSKRKGVITQAKGRVIYTINNRPAAEVYNEWTEGMVKEKLEAGGTVLSETAFYPLAKVFQGSEEDVHYLSIHPLSIDATDKSLTVFADVATGDEIQLMHGDWELLLNRAQSTPRKALQSEGIGKGKGVFGIYTFCAGTLLAIPEEERPKMPLLINNELGNIPFIGTFTFGEQGYLAGVGNKHGNLVNSMIVFTQEE